MLHHCRSCRHHCIDTELDALEAELTGPIQAVVATPLVSILHASSSVRYPGYVK